MKRKDFLATMLALGGTALLPCDFSTAVAAKRDNRRIDHSKLIIMSDIHISGEFDADGKMIVKNGLIDGIYYEYNRPRAYKGLIKVNDYYYYINDGAKPVAGRSYYITRLNDLTFSNGVAIPKGTYEFDAEGKMVLKNGLIDGIYYENSVKVAYRGLIEQDGAFYYINDGAKPVAGREYYVTKTNGLTYNGKPIAKGNYTFAADGKMILD